jgi:hypothetical protein
MADPSNEEVTEDQANQALQQVLDLSKEDSEPQEEPVAAEPEAAPAEEPQAAEEPQTEVAGEPEVKEDDLDSLKNRVQQLEEEREAEAKRYQSRLEALKQRGSQNEEILRTRHLRKSTAADNALKILKAARSGEGVSESDADRAIREIEGTMHPASAQYSPPQASAAATEDQALVLNSFLNEQQMTGEEAEEFGKWIRSEGSTAMSPTEQAVAGQSLDGFLRIAHTRWNEGKRDADRKAKNDDMVGAVKSVQRTQKQAARAASSGTAAPKKQPAGPAAEPDYSKLTPNDISKLMKQSVEQYR